MKVLSVEITDEQVAAGNAAMTGNFTASTIVQAMVRAGVPYDNYVAGRAADRLLQKARKAGRIRAVNNRNWQAFITA